MITWVSALTQASYESHLAGLQKMDGSWPHDKMWPWVTGQCATGHGHMTKCGPLEKGMAIHFSILAL